MKLNLPSVKSLLLVCAKHFCLGGLCLVFFFGADAVAVKGKKAVKEICITFDELPASESFSEVDRTAITDKILAALKKHDVKAAGFVVGKNIGNSFDLLGRWLNGGHLLGNLTYSQQDLNEMGIEQFITDIRLGSEALEPMLSGFGQKKRYFRYPFLHYGSTVEAKRQVKLYLAEHDIVVAHATVVVEDYLYNLSFEKLGKEPDTNDYQALRYEYIRHVLDEVERCEALATEMLHRPCRQILRLRANRLNAEFLDALLTALEDMGYTFVSLDYALKDKLYSAEEAYYGLRGVGYLDMLRLSDPDLLPAE
jgi:peptidoglycan/xylan/chitin deacetylase (PgdA/CDA1 family)